MDYWQIIITTIIPTLFGNVDAGCEKQFERYGIGMHWHNYTAFRYAYQNLIIPGNRLNYERTAEMVFQYMEHLYKAGLLIIDKVDSPIDWCCKLPEHNHVPCMWTDCERKMRTTRIREYDLTIRIKDQVREYIEYMEPILTSWIKNTSALNPKEFCDNRKQKVIPLPTPVLLKTGQGNASDSQLDVEQGQTSRYQNTIAPNSEDFCDNRENPDVSLPIPEIVETEQGNASDFQPGEVHGQTSRYRNFDLNKLPDEV